VLLSFVAFTTYSLHGGHISQEKAFTVLAILNLFRLPIFAISIMFSDTAEALKGLERIKDYLGQVDTKSIQNTVLDTKGSKQPRDSNDEDSDVLVKLENASFSYEVDKAARREHTGGAGASQGHRLGHEPTDTTDTTGGVQLTSIVSPIHDADLLVLRNVSCSVKRGDMVAVVGTVGAGKTSLLSALLGQVTRITGSQLLRGNVAYVAQEHWIQNMTVKDNILFGSPMDAEKYNVVIAASQLRADLQALPAGDMTEIGERGINISGGQKARCSIARCLYADGVDVYMFDDPLAAVDAHVGQGIFSEALMKLLKDKTRIVTMSSNYHLLPCFNKIWVVENGIVTVCQNYQDLVHRFPQYGSTKLSSLRDNDTALPTASSLTSNGAALEELPAQFTDAGDFLGLDVAVAAEDPPCLSESLPDNEKPSSSSASALLEEEDMERGTVSLHTGVRYFGAAYRQHGLGGILAIVVIALLFTMGQSLRVLSDMWIGIWSRGINKRYPEHGDSFFMAWYIIIVAGTVIFVFCRGHVFIESCMLSSAHLHKSMLSFLLKAPVNLYFDVVPLGRCLFY
jgi:ATP-binding cassette, subfamily C (CFTR/MRP), member 1